MTVPEASTTRHTAHGGVRHGALVAYRWVLAALLVDIAVQFFLAGLGVFGGGFDAHVVNSIVVSALAFVVLVLALVAHVGTRDVVLAAVLLLLVGLVQSVFRGLADEGAFWGGLHALDGLVILGITGFLHGTAIRRLRSTPQP
ncbi:hypothetical protein GCU56_22515 [Geodermatophilus sabuli]|uniref:Uncharacterized protein n=1 Tax=Geodermatophilus sabuli TaxID=1564158 RepID=A0A7K3W8V4_9ACTN|nr:DUF6220 domain-containing protein [Geodermatophilus sabuli]NEK60634.1 hypothetical protein [Geodermatophilus sabuli]